MPLLSNRWWPYISKPHMLFSLCQSESKGLSPFYKQLSYFGLHYGLLLEAFYRISEILASKAATPSDPGLSCSWIYHFHFIMLDSLGLPLSVGLGWALYPLHDWHLSLNIKFYSQLFIISKPNNEPTFFFKDSAISSSLWKFPTQEAERHSFALLVLP